MEHAALYTIGGGILALSAALLLLRPTGLVKWIQRKNYQYEVTFSLYMLTPTEKFVFSTSARLPFPPLLPSGALPTPQWCPERPSPQHRMSLQLRNLT